MGSVVSAHPDRLRQCGQALAAALASYVILLCPPPAQPSPVLEEQLSPVRPGLIIETDAYTKTLESRHNRTKGITTDTDANEYMMSAHAEEMFTHDAWLGMQRCACIPAASSAIAMCKFFHYSLVQICRA